MWFPLHLAQWRLVLLWTVGFMWNELINVQFMGNKCVKCAIQQFELSLILVSWSSIYLQSPVRPCDPIIDLKWREMKNFMAIGYFSKVNPFETDIFVNNFNTTKDAQTGHFFVLPRKKLTVADAEGPRGPCPPPGPVKISHKKMAAEGGRIDFMFLGPPPPYPAAGSATGWQRK